MNYKNPVIRGFNPDPSIYRCGEDYYIACSSFEFYPGIPIYHSRDLVNWEIVNYALYEENGLDLKNAGASGGLYAPTLRFHDNTFYLTVTNVSCGGNFIVHTSDIRGKWSQPVYVNQGGIDPSLFFDDDGTVYYLTATADGIMMSEIDITSGALTRGPEVITKGTGLPSTEGPHLYKLNNKYYLTVAEGGTEYGHSETLMRADTPYGDYEICPHGSILSNFKNAASGISATGHSDMTEGADGRFYAVYLAIRPLAGRFLHNLGRETCLSEVTFTPDGWFYFGDHGKTQRQMSLSIDSVQKFSDFSCDFDKSDLDLKWNFVRRKNVSNYKLDNKNGVISLIAEDKLSGKFPTFMGIRQSEFKMTVAARFDARDISENSEGGLCVFYNDSYYYSISVAKKNDKTFINVYSQIHGILNLCRSAEYSGADIVQLYIESDEYRYRLGYIRGGEKTELMKLSVAGLCTEGTMTMTFTGTYVGIYCESGCIDCGKFSVSSNRE